MLVNCEELYISYFIRITNISMLYKYKEFI